MPLDQAPPRRPLRRTPLDLNLGDFRKRYNDPFPQPITKPIPKPKPDALLAELRDGLRNQKTLQDAIKLFGSDAIADHLSQYGLCIVRCSICAKPQFNDRVKQIYLLSKYCCENCAQQYQWCNQCGYLKLKTDDQCHFHVRQLNELREYNKLRRYDSNIIKILGDKRLEAPTDRRPRYRPQRYFGVELEVEKAPGIQPPDLILKALTSIGTDFAIAQFDGSLQTDPTTQERGHNGFEIVTLPATKRYHMTVANWTTFFEVLSPFTQQKPVSTGLHFHVSSTSLTRATIGKVAQFMNETGNIGFLKLMADRDFTAPSPITGKVYAPTFDAMNSLRNVISQRTHLPHCIMAPDLRVLRRYYMKNKSMQFDSFSNPVIQHIDGQTVTLTCKCPEGHYNTRDHYAALNLKTKHPTIEFRIFQGSMNQVHFFAAMDFCDALINFCEDTRFGDLTYHNFLEWFKANRPHHPHLAKWLVILGFIEARKGKKYSG